MHFADRGEMPMRPARGADGPAGRRRPPGGRSGGRLGGTVLEGTQRGGWRNAAPLVAIVRRSAESILNPEPLPGRTKSAIESLKTFVQRHGVKRRQIPPDARPGRDPRIFAIVCITNRPDFKEHMWPCLNAPYRRPRPTPSWA